MQASDRRIADELEDLLDREKALLMAGAVRDLPRLADQKVRLLTRLSAATGQHGLARIRDKAQRNARLLEAAGRGIQSVTERIASLRAGPQPFSTYSADGAKATFGGKGGTMERRA